MSDTSIRHYENSDETAVGDISADTAFFGEPVEAFLEDRKLYFDAFARYYLTFETAYAWVADNSGEVVGFLLGCADTAAQRERWREYIRRIVLRNAFSMKYKLGKRTFGFCWGMLKSILRHEKIAVNYDLYPAHLQIDIRQDHRGEGIGKQLITAYLDQLQQERIAGVHLETTSHNVVACYVYEQLGFQILDSRINRYWSQRFGYQVDDRIYGMVLRKDLLRPID
ncbi:MAG: GNAT family N-acetyltransferase [Acidobacteriaceae bacterium]